MFVRKKILIVDNVEMTRHFLHHILTNAGYTVEAVGSSREAMALLGDDDFDVFFVDIHMPELEGIKFIKELHAIEFYQSVPILAMTTSNPDALKQKGDAIGITDWIKKPISPPVIVMLLKKMGLTNAHHVQSLM